MQGSFVRVSEYEEKRIRRTQLSCEPPGGNKSQYRRKSKGYDRHGVVVSCSGYLCEKSVQSNEPMVVQQAGLAASR